MRFSRSEENPASSGLFEVGWAWDHAAKVMHRAALVIARDVRRFIWIILDSGYARAFLPEAFRCFVVLGFFRWLGGFALEEVSAAGVRDVVGGCQVDDRLASLLRRN